MDVGGRGKYTGANSYQSANKPTKLLKPRRSSSDPPAPPTLLAPPKPPKAPVSSPPAAPPRLSSPTSISLPTRFSSCATCPTPPTRRVSRPCLAASRASRRCVWCRVARGLPLSSTRASPVRSVRRKPPRACRWESRGSRSALPSSGNRRWDLVIVGHCDLLDLLLLALGWELVFFSFFLHLYSFSGGERHSEYRSVSHFYRLPWARFTLSRYLDRCKEGIEIS